MIATDTERPTIAWSRANHDELARQMGLAYAELVRADLREIVENLDVRVTKLARRLGCTD